MKRSRQVDAQRQRERSVDEEEWTGYLGAVWAGDGDGGGGDEAQQSTSSLEMNEPPVQCQCV